MPLPRILRPDALWGTPAGEMTMAFAALPVAIAAIPWGHVWRMYVCRAQQGSATPGPVPLP